MRRLPDGYEITRADGDDVDDLIAVNLAADELFAETGLIDDADLGDHVPADILRDAIGARHVFVARSARGDVVGFTLTSQRGGTFYLDQISVHPDHGKKGIGRVLVERVITDARDRGFRWATLSTFRDVPWNGPFYRKLGFREIGRHKYAPWMEELEAAQTATLDISKRCFMRKRLKLF